MNRKSGISLIALPILMAWLPSYGQKTPNLCTEQLSGPVHVCIIEQVPAATGASKASDETLDETRATRILIYDPRGRMLEESICGEDGCIATQNLSRYGGDEKITRQSTRSFLPPEPAKVSTYFYDTHGRQEKVLTRTSDMSPSSTLVFTYQPDRVRKDTLYDGKGKVQSTTITHFNKDGKPVKQEWFTQGKLRQVTLTTYNSLGLKSSEEILVGRDRCRARKTLYTYDEAGKLVEQIINPKDGFAGWIIKYAYGPSGHIERIAYYHGNGKLQEWDRLICDSHGNWIVLSKYHSRPNLGRDQKEPYEQMIRRIYYYCSSPPKDSP